MNEQLIVKNFGPIKDATVDFKKVTVFIGPTGGGKSTLAKLAAIFRDGDFYSSTQEKAFEYFDKFSIRSYFNENTNITWKHKLDSIVIINSNLFISESLKNKIELASEKSNENIFASFLSHIQKIALHQNIDIRDKSNNDFLKDEFDKYIKKNVIAPVYREGLSPSQPNYIPSERTFLPAIEYSWAGLMRDDIGLPKLLLEFANGFSLARKDISELDIPFLNVKYLHIDGRDFIKIPDRDEPLMLLETASGVQSVTPLLVLLEQLSRDTEQLQSFIIEELELNLYPVAQRDLVYTLLEKCTQGSNGLTITTHSPYVLSALNLALYADKIATLFPHQRNKITKLIPAKYWIKAENFSAYFVANGRATSIFNKKTGLLNESQLDEVSGDFADIFDRLTDLRVPDKKASAKIKQVKK